MPGTGARSTRRTPWGCNGSERGVPLGIIRGGRAPGGKVKVKGGGGKGGKASLPGDSRVSRRIRPL
eukprot:scaffold34_cov124-Isochrysis_galbana.AAC.11